MCGVINLLENEDQVWDVVNMEMNLPVQHNSWYFLLAETISCSRSTVLCDVIWQASYLWRTNSTEQSPREANHHCAGKEFFIFRGTQTFFTVFTAAFDTPQKYDFIVWNVTHVSFSWSAIRCQTCTGHYRFIHSFLNCRFVSLSRMKLESIISFCTWVVTLSARQVGLTYRGICCSEFLLTHLNRFEVAPLHPAIQKCRVCC